MKVIKFVTLDKDMPRITGGQIYDNNIIEILQNHQGFKADYEALETPLSKKYPLIAPIIYLIKGFKLRKSNVIIFNSAHFMRFLILLVGLRLIGHKKILTIHHHFLYMQLKGIKKMIYKPLEWFFIKHSNYIVIPSPYILHLIKDKIKNNKILYWRIPFNCNLFKNCHPMRGVLTYMGTIEERKGLIYLVKALKLMQDKDVSYKLNIVGEPTNSNYFENLQKYIKQYNLNVEFIGFLGEEGKQKIFSKTDIFVFPSLLEGFGMVLIEAQKYGLPIVAFENSAMPYSVKHNINGLLVPTGNFKEFASSITKLIDDRNLRNRLSKNAYDNLKLQNTWTQFEKSVIEFFSE